MSWWECRLLSLSKVVFNVSIEDKFSNWNQGIVSVRNNFSYIKNVPFIVEGISFRNNLNFQFPLNSFALVDMVN